MMGIRYGRPTLHTTHDFTFITVNTSAYRTWRANEEVMLIYNAALQMSTRYSF